MTDLNQTQSILSLCATTSDKLKDLIIKDGQLIFIHDVGRIAFDFKGKRKFYNQIIEIETEIERKNFSEAVNGKYYFVVETAVLWRYFNGWTQITGEPNEILFIGTEMPELGKPKTLYVNKSTGGENISIWDEESNEYKVVADKTQTMTADDVRELFK